MISWGIDYVLKNGEIVHARGNEDDTTGAVARAYRRAENGMPTLEAKGKLYIDVISRDKKEIYSAIKAIDSINEEEIQTIASGIEAMLERRIPEIQTRTGTASANLPNGEYFLDKDGKKINEDSRQWVARYCIKNKEMLIEINPKLSKSYDFSDVVSCIKGLESINFSQLRKISKKLKESLKK